MLQKLEIQNYAIIDRLTIDLSDKLNIITGETGAGKSILLGAIGLILGERADTKVLYDRSKKCYVEATFDVKGLDIRQVIEDADLDYSDELIIRREINAAGKSRAFVNDTPTTLTVLKSLNTRLVDLHRQFDTLDIHHTSYQTQVLDAMAGNVKILGSYAEVYRAYLANKRELRRLEDERDKSLQEMDFLQFQLNELAEAGIQPGEQVAKEDELKRISSTEDLKRVGNLIYHTIDASDESLLDALQSLLGEADSIKSVDTNLSSLYDRLFGSIEELRDVAAQYLNVADAAEYDPVLAEELQARLDVIYQLQNKHRVQSVDDLLQLEEQLAARLKGYTSIGQGIDKLMQDIKGQEAQLRKIGQEISERRSAISDTLVREVQLLLSSLSMPNARLKVVVQAADKFLPTGIDDVSFLFASNKGSDYLPIKDVASGGEVSRLTLSVKALIADAVTLPTLIFDEIDTGVSGEVALRMGEIFAALSHSHQVISITHSPQIAAKADKHFWVYKQDTEERTVTGIQVLDEEGRVTEVGKMLSGDPPSEAALANAQQLISG